jgi:acyl carrier protein
MHPGGGDRTEPRPGGCGQAQSGPAGAARAASGPVGAAPAGPAQTGQADERQPEQVEREIRRLLAEALQVEPASLDRLPPDTPLFGQPLDLGSLSGARLLLAVRDRFGVDVAAEDLALDSLETIASLSEFVRVRLGARDRVR